LNDSSTLWDRAFFYNLTYISGKTDRIFMAILPQICFRSIKSPLNFGSHPDPKFRSGLRTRTGFTSAEVCAHPVHTRSNLFRRAAFFRLFQSVYFSVSPAFIFVSDVIYIPCG